MSFAARLVRSRLSAWLTLVASVLVAGALFALVPQVSAEDAPSAGLPATSESVRADRLLERFTDDTVTPGLLVFSRADGDSLDREDLEAVATSAAELAELSAQPDAVRPLPSDDGLAALVVVPVDAAQAEDDVEEVAAQLREAAAIGLPSGLEAQLTGPVGFQADTVGAFAGADLRLLLTTVAVVAALLIATYRSPLLWLVPLAVVGTADGLARVVVSAIADAVGLPLDASVAGILSVLVFGAGTNYALLLVARYREELRRRESRFEAMRTAVTSAGPAILASGGTVALSLLTLLLGELTGNRALGLACALGIGIAMAFALLVLPAALVVCGRGVFWPFVPRVEEGTPRPGFWQRLGRRVSRRPGVVAATATVGIGVLSLGLVGASVGLSRIDQLVGEPESVIAQRVIDRSFSSGLSASTVVVVPEQGAQQAAAIAEDMRGVESVRAGATVDGYTRIDVSLEAEPESTGALDTVRDLRDEYAQAGGATAEALVGGTDATQLDARDAAARDFGLIAPLILAIVFVILAALLRSLLAPVLLTASVVATFFASIGASSWLFREVLGFPALDTSVPLFAFLFLVALGVDYNIFLTQRAREERAEHGTREGMVFALGATGAVITSAGVLLAAVFAVLGVLPVVALTQIGVIVCIGVLLDTLVVRTLLMPSLVFLLGDRFWWPSRRDAAAEPARRSSSPEPATLPG